MSSPKRSEDEITTCLMALIAWAGNASAASRYLKAEKDIGIASSTLTNWKVRYGERYDELREKYQGQLETNLSNEFRDVARLAVEVERLAIEKAKVKLEKGEDNDPARSAAALSTVAQKSVDKLLSLTGRPTQIREDRNLQEILRSLAAKNIIQLPEEPPQLEAADGR